MKHAPLLLPLFFAAVTGAVRAQCSLTIAEALDLAPGGFTSVGIYVPLGAGEATGNFTCRLADDYVMMIRPGTGPLNPFAGTSGETGFIKIVFDSKGRVGEAHSGSRHGNGCITERIDEDQE